MASHILKKKVREHGKKGIVQRRALIKAVLQACPLTGFPVSLPFNWRGHKKKGAASITNLFYNFKVTVVRKKRERGEREKERLTGMSLDDDQAKIKCKHTEGLIGEMRH